MTPEEAKKINAGYARVQSGKPLTKEQGEIATRVQHESHGVRVLLEADRRLREAPETLDTLINPLEELIKRPATIPPPEERNDE